MTDTVDPDLEDEVPASRKPLVVKVRAFIDAAQLDKDMSYSIADLSTAMARQASLLVHYGALHAKAARQVDDVSMLLEITESKVYRKLRDKAVKEGTKLTEVQLEKSVSVHPQVVAMKRAKNEAKQIESLAKIAVEGFRHRKDMLVQEGATQRQEMSGEVSINARNTREATATTAAERMLQRMAEKAS